MRPTQLVSSIPIPFINSQRVPSTNLHCSSRGTFDDDVADQHFRFSNARRRSNSSTQATSLKAFKTKFETSEPEPVFEESMAEPDEEGMKLEHQSTTSTDSSEKSVEEEDASAPVKA